jgi:hypothetical protein
VDSFYENARSIFETATATASPSDTTILITAEGGVRMMADCDWPLDRLVAHHGARSAYRVTCRHGRVRVDGRSWTNTCSLETIRPPHRAAVLPMLPGA